jgi:hypothetical protein
MIRLLEMFGGVFVLGGIATAHMAAFKADAQVHPCVAYAQAILATICRGLYVTNLVEMGTNGWHGVSCILKVSHSTQDSFFAVGAYRTALPTKP